MLPQKPLPTYVKELPGSPRPFLKWLILFCSAKPIVKQWLFAIQAIKAMVFRLIGNCHIYWNNLLFLVGPAVACCSRVSLDWEVEVLLVYPSGRKIGCPRAPSASWEGGTGESWRVQIPSEKTRPEASTLSQFYETVVLEEKVAEIGESVMAEPTVVDADMVRKVGGSKHGWYKHGIGQSPSYWVLLIRWFVIFPMLKIPFCWICYITCCL